MNNLEILNNMIKHLNENQKIQINNQGEIKIITNNNGKFSSQKAGNLFEFANEIIPLPNKPWVNINSDGIKSWANFGEKLPSTTKKSEMKENNLVGFFLQFCDFNQQPNYFNSSEGFKYDVYKCGDILGYYSGKSLRMVEYKGIKWNVTQKSPGNNTEYLLAGKVNPFLK